MQTELLQTIRQPGEHAFFFKGAQGQQLEANILVPSTPNLAYIALLGHPHSLQGGTMNNKVVTTMARSFKELNIASIRFNFRGVGRSAGEYDAGIGESDDMVILADQCRAAFPHIQWIFAGFSFGSYVAYRAATQRQSTLLITIAPPVHHYHYDASAISSPWHIIQGNQDDVVEANLVKQFAAKATLPLPIHEFPETGHFFHGKLLALKDTLQMIIQQTLVIGS